MLDEKSEKRQLIFDRFSGKEIIFFIVSSALFIALGYFWKELITTAVTREPIDYALPLVITIVFAAIFALTATLATGPFIAWIILPAASFAAILFIPLWVGSYIAWALTALALLYAFYSTRSAYRNSVKFNASHVVKTCLSGTFTAVVLLMSFYYLHVQLTKQADIVPSGLIEGAVSFTIKIFGQQSEKQLSLPSESLKLPVSEGGGISLESLPPEILNLIPSNILEIFGEKKSAPSLDSASASAKTPETGEQKPNLNQQIANTIQAQINTLIEPYRPFIPYAFTAISFLSVRGLMFILGWFVVPLASILLKFLIAIGIVHKEKVQIEAERVFF